MKKFKNYCFEFAKNNPDDRFILKCKKIDCKYFHLTGEEVFLLNESNKEYKDCEFCNEFYNLGLQSLNHIDGVFDFFHELTRCPWNCKRGKINIKNSILNKAKLRNF